MRKLRLYGLLLAALFVFGALISFGAIAYQNAAKKNSLPQSAANKQSDLTTTVSSADHLSRVTVSALGDFLLEDPILEMMNNTGWGSYLDNLLPLLQGDDLTIANQESVIGGEELGLQGSDFVFNAPDCVAQNLADASVEFVSLANNHAFDKGMEGITRTHQNLDAANVGYTGTYESEESAGSYPILEINGMRIAILSTTYATNIPADPSWAVNVFTSPYSDNSDAIVAQTREAASKADAVIVCMHWGQEFVTAHNEEQKIMAQALCDAGATVIIGNHPHCVQPIEMLASADGRQTLCYYSLGNFLSAAIAVDRADELATNLYEMGAIGQFTLVKDENGVHIENAMVEPIVNQFDADFSGFSLIPLKDYTEELANAHGQKSAYASFSAALLREQAHAIFDPSGIQVIADPED